MNPKTAAVLLVLLAAGCGRARPAPAPAPAAAPPPPLAAAPPAQDPAPAEVTAPAAAAGAGAPRDRRPAEPAVDYGRDSAPARPYFLALAGGRRLVVMPPAGMMPAVRREVRLEAPAAGGQWRTLAAVDLPHLPGHTVAATLQERGPGEAVVVIAAWRDYGVRYGAVRLRGDGLEALDYYRLTAPPPRVATGTYVYVNKYLNQLWLYRDGQLLETVPVATGRQTAGPPPTWADYMTNYFTPEGRFRIDQKVKNPVYYGSASHPPAAGGAPANPLGTRWLGFSVLGGADKGQIWALHGTNEPWLLGTWVSDGCIRLQTEDVERLFDRIPLHAVVEIVSGRDGGDGRG